MPYQAWHEWACRVRVHPLGDSFEGGVEWFVNEVYGHYLSMDEGEVYKYCKLPNTFERIVLLQTSTLLKTTLKFTWLVARFTNLSKVHTWSICNLVIINSMPPKDFGGQKIVVYISPRVVHVYYSCIIMWQDRLTWQNNWLTMVLYIIFVWKLLF